jgi:hypothetical protein
MRTIKQVVLSLVILAVASTAAAQVTTFSRVDMKKGAQPYMVQAVLTPQLQYWVFGAPDNPDIELGRLWTVAEHNGHQVRFGGYATYLTKPKEWYILPWVNLNGPVAGGHYDFHLSDYVPLNGGKHFLFMDDFSVMWKKGDWNRGVSFTGNLPEGGGGMLGVGPEVERTIVRGGWTFIPSSRVVVQTNGKIVGRLQLMVVLPHKK